MPTDAVLGGVVRAQPLSRTVVAATIGNVLEWFDFLVYGYFAVMNLIKAGYSGVLPSLLSEQFPVEIRAVGIAFSYSISVTIFGGFAPFVATWLIAQTGDPLSPSYYLMATALLSIIALIAIERRTARPRA